MANPRLWKVVMHDRMFPEKKITLGTFSSETISGAEKKARARHQSMLSALDPHDWEFRTELIVDNARAA